MRESEKILYLESLRGFAAITVAIYHFNIGSLLNNSFTDNGWLMVDFFFVLSGFVIALNYQHKVSSLPSAINFLERRLIRLYPLHLLMLLVYLGVETAKYIVEVQYGLVSNNGAFVVNNITSFIQNLFLIQNLTNDFVTWNGVSWSISAEFYTYAIFGILAVTARQNRLLLVSFSIFVSGAAFWFLYSHSLETRYGFIRCGYSFFLGVLTYNLQERFRYRLLPNFFSYVVFLVTVYLVCISEHATNVGINIFIPLLFCVFIISLLKSSNKNMIKRLLQNKYLVYLGTISYGIYMVHMLVWWIFIQTLRFVFDIQALSDMEGKFRIPIESDLIANLIMLLGLAIIIVLGHLSYKYIEMPANRFRRK
jgi:peptidoglycan/LPS O-acetylase OafA/YrhL